MRDDLDSPRIKLRGIDHVVISKLDKRLRAKLLKDKLVLKGDQTSTLLGYLSDIQVTEDGIAGGWEPGLLLEIVYLNKEVAVIRVSPHLDRWVSNKMATTGGEFAVADGLLGELLSAATKEK